MKKLFLSIVIITVIFGFVSMVYAYRNTPGPKNNDLPIGTFEFENISVVLPIQNGWAKQDGYSTRYQRGGFPDDVSCAFEHNRASNYRTLSLIILASKKAKEERVLEEKEFLKVIKTEIKYFFWGLSIKKRNPTPLNKIHINNGKNLALFQSVIIDLSDGRNYQLSFLGTIFEERRIIVMGLNFSPNSRNPELNHLEEFKQEIIPQIVLKKIPFSGVLKKIPKLSKSNFFEQER